MYLPASAINPNRSPISSGASFISVTVTTIVLVVVALLSVSVAVTVKLCDVAVSKSAGDANTTAPSAPITTSLPLTDQITHLFTSKSPNSVSPSFIDTKIPAVSITGKTTPSMSVCNSKVVVGSEAADHSADAMAASCSFVNAVVKLLLTLIPAL